MRHKHSDYMQWSKTQSRARFNLATSGVAPFPFRELPIDLKELEINGDNSYGYAPLQQAIAAHHGVDPECVVESAGTSMANHLAMAAIIEPGDEVVIEHPAYGPILDIAHYLEANVKRFRRPEESGWAIDSAEVSRCVTPKTRLIVITNLHNPTSVLTPESVLREIGDIARSIGALVLVDEVYLDAVYENTPRTSFHLGPEFVVTSSLTKVYGVSGLRCGWILAQPDLAWKMRRLNDLYGATPVFPGELLSVAAFKHLNLLREKARRIVEADRKLLRDFLAQQCAISAVWTDWGTTSFVRLSCDRGRNADTFLERLHAKFDTSAVPGRFLEMPDHFRIGMGVDTEMFAEGLNRISRALTGDTSIRARATGFAAE
jgi:aspartate/methionine/tyrosine aminotransferase